MTDQDNKVALDSMTMTPKTVDAETEFSRRMIVDSNPSIEQLLRADLASTLAIAIDDAALNGNTSKDE